MDPDPDPEGLKHGDLVDPDSDLEHWRVESLKVLVEVRMLVES
jgi:hypothetical protein